MTIWITRTGDIAHVREVNTINSDNFDNCVEKIIGKHLTISISCGFNFFIFLLGIGL